MRASPAIAALGVVLCAIMTNGCQESDWNASFVPVDSGGGAAVDIRSEFHGFSSKVRVPRMSWTPDGAALRVAGIGPAITGPPSQATLWSVDPASRAVTTMLTIQASDIFAAVDCYPGTTACDLVLESGRVVRRAANGDTATILPAPLNGYFVSENGRFFLYTESDEKMRLLDATTGAKTTLTLPDLTKFIETVAVSNDGAEVDVVAPGGMSITRYNLADGSTTTWPVPAEPGWSGFIHQLQWTSTTLHALVRWRSALGDRYIQYQVDGGTAVTLGTITTPVTGGAFTWLPQLQRMLVEIVSAQDTHPEYPTNPSVVRQFDLWLLRGGVSTRVGRSQFGWLNMALSPDGRTLAYGPGTVLLKTLPE